MIACMWCGSETSEADVRNGDYVFCDLCDCITEHTETPDVIYYVDADEDEILMEHEEYIF